MAQSDDWGWRRDVGDPGSAGEDFSDAHSTPDAHHHTPQDPPLPGACALDIKEKEADTSV